MIRGRKARALVIAVLPQVQPYFSQQVHIEVAAHRRWITIQHARYQMEQFGPEWLQTNDERFPTGSGATFLPGFGAWLSLPHRLRRRLVPQDVVETLLSIGTTVGPEPEREHHVVARNTANGVMVAFDRPGSSGERVEIGPISNELLG